MKNLTTNSTTFRNLFPLATIMVGLLLWIPQGWAVTIHSVAAGGDWNKAETWVGGQVPTADDSVVINGEVAVDYTTIVTELTVSLGGTLVNDNYNRTVTVNGNLVNNGTISNNERGALYLDIAGNITNNGILNNQRINFIEGSATSKIKANAPIESTDIILNANIEIVGNATFTSKINFNDKKLIVNQSNVVNFKGDASGTGTIQGNGKLRFAGSYFSGILTGKIEEIIFDGQEQNIYGQFTANSIIFGGSAHKNITSTTIINGSAIINEGVTLLNDNYNRTAG